MNGPAVSAAGRPDLVVAKDGTGNYTTIQEAVDAAPVNLEQPFIIFIKNGIYNEKIFIEKNFITLIGEDRDNACIIYSELRRNWVASHPGNDWGAAVINIANGVSDISIINLTVNNNYGSTHPDEEKPNDHQFAIRGGGTRVVLLNCIIKADGGDTLSLWNTEDGMYYHANCSFEGWVDYVCPRGWCYITDSKFYGRNLTASIWHDGSNNRDQKFVIRNSFFDGVKNFPLGRNHRDGQFYLLDCRFSSNMGDKPIYPAQPASTYKWGERYFYFNCHRDGGDYNWFADNLNKAPGSPSPEEITAEWTFAGKWNPEKNISSFVPFAFQPFPADYAKSVKFKKIIMAWQPAFKNVSYNIYFGNKENPEFIKNVKTNEFNAGRLKRGATYYWRVDIVSDRDTIPGQVWQFTTG
jgi:pectinesterase